MMLKLVVGAITVVVACTTMYLVWLYDPRMRPVRIGSIVIGVTLAVGVGAFALADKLGLVQSDSGPEGLFGPRR